MVALLLLSQRLTDLIFMLHEAEANQYVSAMNVPVKPFKMRSLIDWEEWEEALETEL
jgi:hypothetical protein